jgi:tetratricopeptide (TPR) repeat protein
MSVVTAFPAQSQDAPAPAAGADNAGADAIFRQGNDLYKKGQFAEAEAAYERAFGLKQTYDIASNLAYAEMRLGKHVEAATHLAFALKNYPPVGSEEKKKIAIERLETLKKSVATLRVLVEPKDAEIFVDGKALGRVSQHDDIFVEPGDRIFEAKLAGFGDERQQVQAVKGEADVVTIRLRPLPVQATPSEPPRAAVPVAPVVEQKKKSLLATPVPPVEDKPKADMGPKRAIIFAGGATTLAGLGTGIVLVTLASNKHAQADALIAELGSAYGPRACVDEAALPQCGEVRQMFRDRATLENAAVGTFVGTGLLAVATVTYMLLPPRLWETSRVQATPWLTATGGGASLRGSF